MTVDIFLPILMIPCAIVVALMTALPLIPHPHWIFRGLDFPRLQIAVGALILLALQIALLDFEQSTSWLLVSVVALCLAGQLWWILPYTPLWAKEVKAARSDDSHRVVTILTSNVLTPNRNAVALIHMVEQHKPDVLVTLESD